MIRCFTTIGVALAACCSVTASIALAEDVVHLLPAGRDEGRVAVRGEIVDYTGKIISIAPAGGEARSFPAERVVEIETAWHAAHEAGREALAKRDFEAAARHLAEANRGETRVWARRLILADLMRAYASLGRPEQAGELLLVLAQSDPTTPALADAPLAWFADDRVSRAKAAAWLAQREQPIAVLLGASYLLSTNDATAARQALFELAKDKDPRIATLAEALLWRSELQRATPNDIERWAGRIEQMPAPLRAGPYYILGQAYERLGLPDDAALAYLRVPVLYPERRELAARALVSAGRQLKGSGQRSEAETVWREVVATYPDTPQRTEADLLLDESS